MPQITPNPEMDKFYEEMKAKGMTFPQIMDLWEQQHPQVPHVVQPAGPIYGVPPDLGAQPIYDKIGGQIDPMRHHTFLDFLRGGGGAQPRRGPTAQPGVGTSQPGPDGKWISDGTVSNGWGGYFPAGTDITGYGTKWMT
jgi:hypothetical protein